MPRPGRPMRRSAPTLTASRWPPRRRADGRRAHPCSRRGRGRHPRPRRPAPGSPSSCTPTRSRRATTPGSASTSATPPSSQDGRLAGGLAVPRRRHLHLRRLARLPRPTQPHPHLDQHPADQRLAAAADHARPAGRVQPGVPALRQRPGDQHQAQHSRPVREGVQAGHRRGRRPRSPRPRRWASCRAARSGTTSRGTTSPTPRAASPRCTSSAPGPSSCTRSATSPASTPAPARASSRSTTPGCCGRAFHAARPDLDRAVGRPGQHLDVVHPRRRLDARPPDEAVPGRPRREVGRGHDQHRPQLPRPQLRPAAPAAAATATAPRSTSPTTRGSRLPPRAARRTRSGHRAQVPAQGAGRLPRPGQGRLDAAAHQVGEHAGSSSSDCAGPPCSRGPPG